VAVAAAAVVLPLLLALAALLPLLLPWKLELLLALLLPLLLPLLLLVTQGGGPEQWWQLAACLALPADAAAGVAHPTVHALLVWGACPMHSPQAV
jgi:hypothetical protein